MSTARRLRLFNWICFRGEHVLDLRPAAYAVVARREGDEERSNWQGKTALVEALRFALDGTHRKRTEDEWIFWGEPEGGVQLELDDGLRVSRSRFRGKRTRLEVEWQGATAVGDEAQKLIDERLGIQPVDYDHTWYFGQRQTARIVLARPEDRMEIISGWVGLGPLERAEEHNAEVLDAAIAVAESHRLELSALPLEEDLGKRIVSANVELLHAEGLLLAASRRATECDDEERRILVRVAQWGRKDEYDALVVEGKALAASLKGKDRKTAQASLVEAQRESDYLLVRERDARRQAAEKRRLRLSGFDGQCPVVEDECPARRWVEEVADSNNASIGKVVEVAEETGREAAAKRAEVQGRIAELGAEVMGHDRLQELRARAAAMGEEVRGVLEGERPDPEPPRQAAAQARRDEAEAGVTLARARDALAALARAQRRRGELAQQLEAAEVRVAVLRRAALVLGRTGAQRRVAAPFLAQIERGANEALAECGVDLGVKLIWEHEGKGPAKNCSACGQPFPRGAKAKECARCGGPRGRHVVNRLEFELTDQSAAAEDLAGVVLQLAAGAWLRRRRSAQVGFAVLDEPLAHCDRAHRRAMTRAFVALLGGRFGYAQSFTIMHSAEVGAFPGIIRVTGGPNGSRAEASG